jgi:WD40 repeat protein
MSASPNPLASPNDAHLDSETTPLHTDYERPNSRHSSAHSHDGMDIDSRQSPGQLDSRTPILRSGLQSPRHSEEHDRESYYDGAQSPPNAGRDAYDAIGVKIPTQLHYKISMTLEGHKKAVSAVQFSPDGTKIASCCV